MVFSSTVFLFLFLPAVIAGYFCLKKHRKMQNIFLLLASLFFYAWGSAWFVSVLLLSIIANYVIGIQINRHLQNQKVSRHILAIGVVLNMSVFIVYKYLGFLIRLVNGIFRTNIEDPQISLPLGISFFTFQVISYLIDVNRGRFRAERNLISFSLYICFFPQLIVGPIVRYDTVADQISSRKDSLSNVAEGWSLFIIGLSKKVLLANSFSTMTDRAFTLISSGSQVSVLFSWLSAICYSLQIYFDFSGYSDMAVGLGRIFGFGLPQNFLYPYVSKSVSEFWRRWHISLASWFKDYVYIPLGGNRVSRWKILRNLLIVWALTGLWHGPDYSFLLWGLMFFGIIGLEKNFKLPEKLQKCPVLLTMITFCIITLAWVLFRADSIQQAIQYYLIMFGLNGNRLIDRIFTGYFAQYWKLLAIGLIACTPICGYLKSNFHSFILFQIGEVLLRTALFILSVASYKFRSDNTICTEFQGHRHGLLRPPPRSGRPVLNLESYRTYAG